VPARELRLRKPLARDRDGIRLAAGIEDGNPDLPSERLELRAARRPREVRRHEQRIPSARLELERQLARRRRLARALQPDERDDGGPAGKIEVGARAAEERDQLVAD